MVRRPHLVIFGVALLLTLAIWILPSRTATQLKQAISGLFLPLFGLSESAHKAVERAGNTIVPRAELLRQIDQLQKLTQELQIRAMQGDEAARENARLRQYLGWQKQAPWKLKLARVVGRDPANWWRTLKIDLGNRDGIAVNAPVITPAGLVGRVSETSYTQAQVVLLGNPDCRVSVKTAAPPYEHGVIAPASSSPMESSMVDLSYLSRGSQLKPGAKVVTSGLGGIFPAGIHIGQIVDSRSVDYGLFTEARVKLAVDMNNLEEVWIVLP